MQQDIKIIATNPIEFFKVAQEAIVRGARYKGNTFVSLQTTMPLMVELTVEVDEEDPTSEWKDKGPHIWATPLPVKEFKYSKQQLDDLEWNEFKKVVATKEITGRDRQLMTTNYLKATNQI